MGHASTADGWRLLWANQNDAARAALVSAVRSDPKDARAFLGLAVLDAEEDRTASELAHAEAIYASSPSGPEAIGYWSRFRRLAISSANWTALGSAAQHILAAANVPPTLRAAAELALADSLDESGKSEEAKALRARIGFVTRWNIAGPFNNRAGQGRDKLYPPEKLISLKAPLSGEDGKLVSWRTATDIGTDGLVDAAAQLGGNGDDVYYAATSIVVGYDQTGEMSFDPAGASKVWLDGNLINADPVYRDSSSPVISSVALPVKLDTGWHTVVVKLARSSQTSGGGSFRLRFSNPDGQTIPMSIALNPVNGVQLTSAAQPHTETATVSSLLIAGDDPALLLLAGESCLNSGDFNGASAIFTRALTAAPDSSLLHRDLSLAETGAGKTADAAVETDLAARGNSRYIGARIDYIRATTVPASTDRIGLLKSLFSVNTASPAVFGALAVEYSAAGRASDAANAALEQIAFNSNASGLAWLVQLMTTAGESRALIDKVVNGVLSKSPSEPNIEAFAAGCASQEGQTQRAIALYEKALRFNPADTNSTVALADLDASSGHLTDAISLGRTATQHRPWDASVWVSLGEHLAAAHERDDAAQCYAAALAIDPGLGQVRLKLERVSGIRSPLDLIDPIPAGKIVTEVLPVGTYSGASSVVLLDDEKRLVYADGAQLTRRHEVVRILSADGSAAWSTFEVPQESATFNPTVESVRVYRAAQTVAPVPAPFAIPPSASVKPTATGAAIAPIPPPVVVDDYSQQVVGGTVQIPRLAPGDTLELKYRASDYNPAAPHGCFWTDFRFDHPGSATRLSRFVLITPRDYPYQSKLTGAVRPGSSRVMKGWRVAEWSSGVEGDALCRVDASSVPNWGAIARWYYALLAQSTAPDDTVTATTNDIVLGKDSSIDKLKAIVDYLRTLRCQPVPFWQSGYVPLPGKQVIATLSGDGKDEAALLDSMLQVLGTQYAPVLVVGQRRGDEGWLPSVRFDRMITRVSLDSGPVWVDLSADPPIYGTPLVANRGWKCLRVSPAAIGLETLGEITSRTEPANEAALAK